MHLTFRTAGESHGRGLVALLEGVPAGLSLSVERDIDPELRRRQGGYGRGGRMAIEQDRAEVLAGVRLGETMGGPVALLVWNRDWENWQVAMAPEAPDPATDEADLRRVHLPRPGHADLVGILKYGRADARDVLERASARETTARVAAGAVARRLLAELGIRIGSHIVRLGAVEAARPADWPEDLNAVVDASPLRTLDRAAEARMIEAIDAAQREGDTLGGVFEVVVTGLPVGLGSYVAWDRRLDGRLAGALMSIQAMKGVEIGLGFEAAKRRGSQVHDEIEHDPEWSIRRTAGYKRLSNNAGGLEGGITTGAPLIARVAMKPLSTLMKPLRSVDVRSKEPADAIRERSDVAALAAAGVVGEAMVALVLADAVLEKFGGDSVGELRRNLDAYLDELERHGREVRERGEDAPYESGVAPGAEPPAAGTAKKGGAAASAPAAEPEAAEAAEAAPAEPPAPEEGVVVAADELVAEAPVEEVAAEDLVPEEPAGEEVAAEDLVPEEPTAPAAGEAAASPPPAPKAGAAGRPRKARSKQASAKPSAEPAPAVPSSHRPVPGVERIVLVGFMAVGKSTVGRRLAERLGWEFLDFDDLVLQREGRSAAAVIRQRGEAAFRALEAELTEELAGRQGVVLAPGGGWGAQPELAETLGPGTLRVWLRLPLAESLRRAERDRADRPLLGDRRGRTERMTSLLATREPEYARAEMALDIAGMEADSVVSEIMRRLHERSGGQ